jgi:glycosyltransferase involved in cell wall biosynthesis
MIATQAAANSPNDSEPIGAGPTPTIGMIVTTWPRLSQTFVLREVLGLEALGVGLRIFSLKVPPDEPVHADVSRVRATVTYLAFRRSWKPILAANLRLARGMRGRYFRAWILGLHNIRYGNVLHVLKQLLRAGYVADILRREPVQRIHAHFATAPASVAMFTSELTGIPYTIAVHANDIFVKARGRLMNAKIERAEAVVANNEYNRRYLLSRFGAKSGAKFGCVYNGLDLSQFQFHRPRAGDPGPPLILSVGRMVEKKGFADLLLALRILRDQGREFQAEIIGSGPLKEEIQGKVKQLHLEDCVRLLGARHQEFVRSAYQRATLFVLACVVTSNGDRDGIPNVLYEAMASGTPVISTPIAAIPELINSGHNGLLVSPRNPAMLADAIDRLLLAPELRDRLAQSARQTIEARFTIDRTARELFELFRKLNNGRASNRRTPQLMSISECRN